MVPGPSLPNNPNQPGQWRQRNVSLIASRAKSAMEYLQRGDFRIAERLAQELRREFPDQPVGCRIMAQVSNFRGSQGEAIRWIDQAIYLNPGNPEFLVARSQFCHDAGRVQEALDLLDQVTAAGPLEGKVRWRRMLSLERLGRTDDAMKLLKATSPQPPHLEAFRARLEDRDGQREAARERLKGIVSQSDGRNPVRGEALFQLSRVCDKLGDYDAAFAAAAEANARYRGDFDPAAHERSTDALIDYFTPERFDELPRGEAVSDMPVYIIGLPRSGTSLLEQIIDAHPQAAGSGERREPLIVAEDLAHGSGTPFPDCLDGVTQDALTTAGKDYLQMLGTYGAGMKRIANKALSLDRIAGLLPLITPGCRIIFVHRQPLDNLLSIFLHPLRGDRNPWAQSLDDLVEAWKAFDRLSRHWASVLPCPCLDVAYESLVHHQQQTTADLLEFLELPWDDACMRFHESGRSVNTPSYDQVNTPMNSHAVDRWRNYAAHIKPLLQAFPPEADGDQ